ncbi:MAG: hypothetical protein ACHRHE_11365 [Tepidisphaerales bacterium]
MAKRSDWISALLAVGLVVGYALWTRPGTGEVETPGTRIAAPTWSAINRVYDVRDLLARAEAYNMYRDSFLTEEERKSLRQTDKATANAGEVRWLLQILHIRDDATIGPIIDGRVCVVASEHTHALIERLLRGLRLGIAPTEVKP